MQSKEKNKNVRFRFEFSPMTTPKKAATMMTNERVDFSDNELKELSFELDTTHLVPSRYQVDVIAFVTDEFGNDCQLEGVFPGFVFDMNESPTDEPLLWRTYNWGAVHLNEVKVKKED